MNDLILIYDTETTGIPIWDIPSDDPNQPHLVQLTAGIYEKSSEKLVHLINYVIAPQGWEIPLATIELHGITNEFAHQYGVSESYALSSLNFLWQGYEKVGHNISFDNRIIRIGLKRNFEEAVVDRWKESKSFCTMIEAQKILGGKRLKLSELYRKLFDKEMPEKHDSLTDMFACAEIYFKLQKLKGEFNE